MFIWDMAFYAQTQCHVQTSVTPGLALNETGSDTALRHLAGVSRNGAAQDLGRSHQRDGTVAGETTRSATCVPRVDHARRALPRRTHCQLPADPNS